MDTTPSLATLIVIRGVLVENGKVNERKTDIGRVIEKGNETKIETEIETERVIVREMEETGRETETETGKGKETEIDGVGEKKTKNMTRIVERGHLKEIETGIEIDKIGRAHV